MTLPPRLGYVKKGRDGKLRSKRHIDFVRTFDCILSHEHACSGRIEVCHCRDVAPRGHGGGKPDDYFVVSMCQRHHRLSEKREVEFGRVHSIDILALCLEFAEASPDKAIREAAKQYRAQTRAAE
jgi:hypothetical protein